MITIYFTLKNTGKYRCYAQITAESEELAKYILKLYHPGGYSGIYEEDVFRPSKDQKLILTIKQRLTN